MLKFYKKHKEIILYIIVGGCTTLVSFIVYALGVELLSLSETASNCLSWVIAVAFAFITNKVFVFESRSFKGIILLKEGLSFLGSRVFSGLVEIFGFELLVYIGLDKSVLGIDCFLAKIIINVVVIILNFILSKLFVFKKQL